MSLVQLLNKSRSRPRNKNVATNTAARRHSGTLSDFNIYMTANGLHQKSDEIKVAIFLKLIGEEGIDVFNNFKLSQENQKKYEVMVKKFDEYLLPKKNIIYERFLFYKRVQESNEPVDNFVKELKKLAQNCEFGDEQDMIRDKLVLGIANVIVLEKLLSLTDLKLESG